MNKLLRLAVFIFMFADCVPAMSQWQTPNHSAPIGRGAGITGFGSVGPCALNVPFVGTGASSDPACGPVDLSNAGSATGNLPVGRLNGGTNASALTFWNGAGVWASVPFPSLPTPPPPQGRLTLTSGVPYTQTDVSGAVQVFYTPVGGQSVPIWNGSTFVFTDIGGEQSVTLGSNWLANNAYDWFEGLNAGVPTLCSSPPWTNSGVGTSARGTGAGTPQQILLKGIYVNAAPITCNTSNTTSFACATNLCTYLGSTLTIAAGQVEDSRAKRYLYNQYNQALRPMLRQDTTSSWSYSTASYEQARATAANQLSYFAGNTGSKLHVSVRGVPLNSTATIRIVYSGIGLNSTAVNSRTDGGFCRIADATVVSCQPTANFDGFTSFGLNNVVWLEKGAGTDTQTWFGNGGGTDFQSGISGDLVQ